MLFIIVNNCTNNKRYFTLETKEIDYLSTCDNILRPELIDYYPLGVNSIMSYDDYLVLTTSDPSGLLKVYDIEKRSEIVSVCPEGRAINELINPILIDEQIYEKDGDIILPIIDNGSILKEINLTKSIISNRAMIAKHTICENPVNSSFVLLNNNVDDLFVLRYPDLTNGGCGLPEVFIEQNGEQVKKIDVYQKIINGDNRMDIYSQYLGRLYKHPNKNLIIQPLQSLNYILFFDIDENRTYAIHQEGSRSFADNIPDNFNQDYSSLCFGDVAVASDRFFVLYFSRCRANPELGYKTEILSFDWNGNCLWGAKIDIELHRITYNSKQNCLYGINIRQEKLYKISL